MTITVPKSVDVKGLVAQLNMTDTKSKNLKYRIYYFLSRVVIHNDNVKLNEDNNYYRSICSNLMKQILGNNYYYEVIKLLMNPNDPIVECNESYSTGNYCLKYRLTQKYNTGDIIFKELPKNLSKRIQKLEPEEYESIGFIWDYNFLIEQYQQHQLTLSKKVYEYIFNFSIELSNRVVKNNEYQNQMIYNLIGCWLYYIKKIEEGVYNPLVSESNHRLNSIFTRLPKVIRGFILCNEQPLYNIDISASQPYILATIMNHEFLLSKKENEYNLYSIYPSLYNKIINDYTSISSKQYINNLLNNNIDSLLNNNVTNYSFMWCDFFYQIVEEDIKNYKNIPFNEDYYLHVVKMGLPIDVTEDKLIKERSNFKKNMMFILFDDNTNNRYHNTYIQLMNKVYPTVNKWIETNLKFIGGKTFSLLLQRTESYLLLNRIARSFHLRRPSVPIFTIHDGLYTYQEFLPDLTSLTVEGLTQMTGIVPGIKTESPRMDIYPLQKDVDKQWAKIKNINSQKKFNEVRGGVFTSNIERGVSFLKQRNIPIILNRV